MKSVKLNNSGPLKVHGLDEGGSGGGIETKFLIFKHHYNPATDQSVPLCEITFKELSELYTKYVNHEINLVVLLAKDSGGSTDRTITKAQLNYVQIAYINAQPEYGMNNDSIVISASGLYASNPNDNQIVFIDQWAIKDDDTITYSPINYVVLQKASS